MTTCDSIPAELLLPKVKQTCIEMLEDRGYTIAEVNVNNPAIVATRGTDKEDDEECHVIIHDEARIGVKALRNVLLDLTHRIIFVSSEGPTSFTRKECSDLRIEFWTFAQLMFNISRFAITPRHCALSADEERTVTEKYNAEGNNWPKIYSTDPMCRYYNFPVGSLIRIERTFYAPHVYYRRVIAGP